MTFAEPIPFAEAIAKMVGRRIIPSAANTARWSLIETALRERAFFSSRVESARVLQSMRDYLVDFLQADRAIESHGGLRASGRAEFVANMREIAIREGLGKIDPKTGKIDPNIRENDLTDIRSIRRLQLIFDTQTEAANEYGYWQQGQDPDILNVFPAQRFIRIRPVLAPRPYHAAAEGEIRRKDDLQFWLSLNRDFGVPWGPWGFGSGMGVEDVDREEAEAAGAIKPGERVQPTAQDFNSGLSASTQDLDKDILAALARTTGGTSAAGRLAPRASDNGGELDRAFPKPGKLSPETIGQYMRKLARHDGRPLLDKATIDITDPFVRRLVEDSLQHLGSMLPPSLTAKLNRARIVIAADHELRGVAGSYNRRTGRMRLNARLAENPLELAATVVHEAGHWIWPQLSDSARRRVRAHFAKRTRGETPFTRGGKRYFRDQWAHELAGLEGGEEVIPYHLEILAQPPETVAARLGDPYQRETLELIMNLIGIIP